MKLAFNIGLSVLFTFGFLYSNGTLSAFGKQEFTQSIKKDFPLSTDGTAAIYNTYGQVDIKTWDRNRIKIEVHVRVRAMSEEDAKEVFERIFIDFTSSQSYVKAETEIEPQNSSWWSWGKNEDDFNIDYEVFMPRSARLDLRNQYGDASVLALDKDVMADIKYGNLALASVGGNLNVSIAYGAAEVATANTLKADLSYCKFELGQTEDAVIHSKYSKVAIEAAKKLELKTSYDTYQIERADHIRTNGKYDNFSIGTVNNITGYGKYSDFNITDLVNSADFDMQYGNTKVQNVHKGFTEVRLVGRHTDFKIGVEEGANYVLNAAADYAGIRYPRALQVKLDQDKGTSQAVKGFMGIKNAHSIIRAEIDYGALKVE